MKPTRIPPAEDYRLLRSQFLRCFTDVPGRTVLDHLRRKTVEARLPPDTPEAVLRDLEGQRRLVAYIETMMKESELRDGKQR